MQSNILDCSICLLYFSFKYNIVLIHNVCFSDACMTVTAPKTPGMTIRRTKRKIQEKKVEIDLNSPDTSISFANTEVQGKTIMI